MSAQQKTTVSIPFNLKRLGVGGFVLFFAKGLLWLAVPWVAQLMAT